MSVLTPRINDLETELNSISLINLNYIENPHFDVDVTGWISAANVTITRNTTSPLRGDGDGVITKDAANRIGEFVYTAFNIAAADVTTILTLTFDYKTSANYADDDIGVYLYDVTNSAYVYPADQSLKATTLGKARYQFQTTTSTSYQLRFKADSTNANSYTVNIDNLVLSHRSTVTGLAGWKQYDLFDKLTFTNKTASTKGVAIPYKTLEGSWRLRFNILAWVSVNVLDLADIAISGVTFATPFEAITVGTTSDTRVGTGNVTAINTLRSVIVTGAASTLHCLSGDVELASKPTWAVDYSNVVLSEESSNRQIAFSAYLGTAANHTIDGTLVVPINTVTFDTTNSFNSSNNSYVIPETGLYHLFGLVRLNSVTTSISVTPTLYKNGSPLVNGTSSGPPSTTATLTVPSSTVSQLTKGDFIQIALYKNSATSLAYGTGVFNTYLNVTKLSSPQTIAASEKVVEIWSDNSGQAINTATTTMTFNTKETSTHGAFSGSLFTCPRSGIVTIASIMTINSINIPNSTSGSFNLQVEKNGITIYTNRRQGKGVAAIESVNLQESFSCIMGDVFRISHNSSVSGNLSTTATRVNRVSFIID